MRVSIVPTPIDPDKIDVKIGEGLRLGGLMWHHLFMEHQYFFVVIWGELSSGSGVSASSFQCGSAEDLVKVGADPQSDWEGFEEEGGSVDLGEVQVWDRSSDELTYILGRGKDYDAVSRKFFSTIQENFSSMLQC